MKIVKYLAFMFVVAMVGYLITGCGPLRGEKGNSGDDGMSIHPAPISSEDSDIASVLADENEYRLGLGQTQLSSGLSCTLYSITGGDRIQAFIAGHNTLTGISQVATFLFKGVFDQADSPVSQTLNVLPIALRPLYTNMYLLRCQGQIAIRNTDYYQFDLTSDDGSVLYLDGSKLVDNDNNHGAVLVSGSKYLRRGVHTFRLDYAQSGGGNQALQLKVGGNNIDPKYYAH